MKRADLIRHIESHGCLFVREGSKHTVYRNLASGSTTTIPRHRADQEATCSQDLRRFRNRTSLSHEKKKDSCGFALNADDVDGGAAE
jgi:predicted RNA binding protein YcfA (HicA-like mRNA interferase family)